MLSVSEKKKKDCCGCGLCASLCPKSAITMVKDTEGFLYPSVDSTSCVECGLCVKECSFLKPTAQDAFTQEFIVGRSKDSSVLGNSASGGVFTHLSDTVLDKSGVVYGACYDSNFNVVHRSAFNKKGRDSFRDSKYIQSNIAGVFKEVGDNLKDGYSVLFSGTPCQCAAIYRYLNKYNIDVTNLSLIDIICHGVGSPLIWIEYLEYTKKKYGIDCIDRIITRNKKIGADYNLTIFSKNKNIVRKDVQDPYISLFSNNLVLRPSCFSCPFKEITRCTDITIGDFQKVKRYYPQFSDKKGVSVVIVNTNKGSALFDSIKNIIDFEESDKKKASQANLYKQIDGFEERENFFMYLHHHSFQEALDKYTEEGLLNHVKGMTKRFIKYILRM